MFTPNQLVVYTNPEAMPGPWKEREGKIATVVKEERDDAGASAGFEGAFMVQVQFHDERNPVRCYATSLQPYVAG